MPIRETQQITTLKPKTMTLFTSVTVLCGLTIFYRIFPTFILNTGKVSWVIWLVVTCSSASPDHIYTPELVFRVALANQGRGVNDNRISSNLVMVIESVSLLRP